MSRTFGPDNTSRFSQQQQSPKIGLTSCEHLKLSLSNVSTLRNASPLSQQCFVRTDSYFELFNECISPLEGNLSKSLLFSIRQSGRNEHTYWTSLHHISSSFKYKNGVSVWELGSESVNEPAACNWFRKPWDPFKLWDACLRLCAFNCRILSHALEAAIRKHNKRTSETS